MDPSFRQSKYLNESGSKKGNYFLNRLDYFEFHQYPKFKQHKFLAVIGFLFSFYFVSYFSVLSGIFAFIYLCACVYLTYISGVTFLILHRQVCRYRGYILFPKSWFNFWLSVRKEVDISDFDSCATLNDK